MEPLRSLGRLLLLVGVCVAALGTVILLISRSGSQWRLPGDLLIQKRNFILYIPVVSMLLISGILTVVLNVLLRR